MLLYILPRFLVWKTKKIIILDIMTLYILVWSFPITSSESSRYPSSLSFSTAIAVMTLEMSPMGNLEDEVADNPAESWPYPVGNTQDTINS